MVRSLEQAALVYGLALGVWLMVGALRPREVTRLQQGGLLVLQGAVTLAAVLDSAAMALRGGVADPVPHAAYLLVVVLALPAAALWARDEGARWRSVLLGGGCLAVAVLLARVQATGAGA